MLGYHDGGGMVMEIELYGGLRGGLEVSVNRGERHMTPVTVIVGGWEGYTGIRRAIATVAGDRACE
jgi:hypothetical protein